MFEIRVDEDGVPVTKTGMRGRFFVQEEAIVEAVSQITAATAAVLEQIAVVDAEASWDAESKSTAHWLSWRCGFDLATARTWVSVARRLKDLPGIRAAFQKAELSFPQVAALVKVATPETEKALIEIARAATGAQLSAVVKAYGRVLAKVAAETAEEAYGRRQVSINHYEDDGLWRFSATLPPEEGALLKAALQAVASELTSAAREGARSPDDYPGLAHLTQASWADALMAIAESALAAGIASRSAPERTQVVVHVSAETLTSDEAGQHCEIDDGPDLAPESARRLACDATLVALVESAEGQPLSVGRRTRKISPALRKALAARDNGCRFPGCAQRRFVEAHHIEHWARGGETSLSNLVTLCWWHHHHLHEGGYTIQAGAEGTFTFFRPDGEEVPSPGLPGDFALRERHYGVVEAAEALCRYNGGALRYADVMPALFDKDRRIMDADWVNHRPRRSEARAKDEEPEGPEEPEEILTPGELSAMINRLAKPP